MPFFQPPAEHTRDHTSRSLFNKNSLLQMTAKSHEIQQAILKKMHMASLPSVWDIKNYLLK